MATAPVRRLLTLAGSRSGLLLLAIGASMLVPDTLLCIVAGALFGLWWGTALAAIQRAVLRDEVRLQVLLRLTPLNPATVSYLLGAAGVRFPGFLAACLAITPHLFIEVYFGHAGKHVARLAGGTSDATRLHDVVVIGGLVVAIGVIVILSRVARKAVMQAVEVGDQTRAANGA